jgi:hypothetical protein
MKSLLTLSFLFTTLSLKAGTSETRAVTTSILNNDCLITSSAEWEAEPEIDFLSMICPSYGGYQVEISGGDIRYDLKLSYAGTQLPTEDLGAFHDMLGSKIEWRYKLPAANDFKAQPKFTALVYGLSFQDYDEKTEENFENYRVIAIKLAGKKSCIVARIDGTTVKSEEEAYQKARELADNAKAPCLK